MVSNLPITVRPNILFCTTFNGKYFPHHIVSKIQSIFILYLKNDRSICLSVDVPNYFSDASFPSMLQFQSNSPTVPTVSPYNSPNKLLFYNNRVRLSWLTNVNLHLYLQAKSSVYHKAEEKYSKYLLQKY